MQIIKSVSSVFIFLFPLCVVAQSGYLLPGTKEQQLINRLEIKAGTNEQLNFSTIRPYNRKYVVHEVELLDSLHDAGDVNAPKLTETDRYNIDRFLMNNSEWSKPRESFSSKKPILKHFYKSPGNLLEVNNPDFFLVVNPLIQYQQTKESGNDQFLFYNSRGLTARGMIDKKIGFNIYITDNQERSPRYVQEWITRNNAVPGAGFFKPFMSTGGVDYLDVRGTVSFRISRHVDAQFGYDRNFIGAGYRSLFLSDFSNNAVFLKLNTRVWKFHYQNLFMELQPQFATTLSNDNKVLPRKYFRSNYLSINPTKWLNLGLFDAVTFGRRNRFDFLYLTPVMFLRPAEQQAGSPDNAMLGFDAKANIRKTLQVYGQFIFDEFKLSELTTNRGWWANKYGYQVGMKYIDAFGINNLDLQVESNRVRPFTYSHFDSAADYTHYNQPFAHPLGANFQEYLAIARYQPFKKLYLQAKLIHFRQGLDSGSQNYGANPRRVYINRPQGDYGYVVGGGNKVTSNNLQLLASYEVRENLFLDAVLQRRTYNTAIGRDQKANIISLGVRWNMARRDFDF
ncbi:hypothetical protein EXU57_18310 [Segetibacter sp. 3557_3]|uniref:capsule assembly Wzi family protein n=1 Tax=Segetibacter sp. 3557_3 TaxID=2547429 RepID=UPI001059143E|nr:capsule assembly Wzi family protein [Segetibacter sp. 3557_3]TDH23014.1 hypothetical protein EXU57_18310 [Segetibacter sp. 3557_3]